MKPKQILRPTPYFIALAIKKGYVPGKVILEWIQECRIEIAFGRDNKDLITAVLLRDFEQQAKEMIEEQNVNKRIRAIAKALARR